MDVHDKVVIVTGASQGIGRATAKRLAARGAWLVLAARTSSLVEALARELPGSLPVVTDVRKDDGVAGLFEKTLGRFGRVDILINLAGQAMWAPVEKIDLGDYRDLIDLNVMGYLRTMQAAIPVMRRQGGGMIVNVSSMTTARVIPNLAGYASTKYAVNALTLAAREELRPDGIVVCLMRPRLVETDFGRNAAMPEPDALRDRSNTSAPPMDTPEFVAEKIEELIRSEAAELNLG
jgi:NAD(P)-dependent dehydrogenase (short-subunit alcohol dehydrogenase family)